MTEQQVTNHWIENVMRERQQNKVFTNVFIGHFEADILEITKSGYSYEYEVKLTKADFKRDCLKRKYDILKHDIIKNGERVNYFFYVVPKGMLTIDEVPVFAGLVEVEIIDYRYSNETKKRLLDRCVKSAPKLSKDKFTPERLIKCYESVYYKFNLNKIKQVK